MRGILLVVAFALVAVVGASLWQELRYLRLRQERVQDHQPLFHSADVFHVVSFLELAPGADLYASLRALRTALEAEGGARMIYAGQVAINALASRQLVERFGGEVPWDAVVLAQFPSRAGWERAEGYRKALSAFARSYSHGMKRRAAANLAIPLVLLAERVRQIVTRAPSHFPFEPDPGFATGADPARIARLAAARELGRDAVLVVNLGLLGTAEQQAADRGYTRRMFGLMAEGVHGPMHMGRAVDLGDGERFDGVALVYYPGVDYFLAMAQSRFYQGIVGGKQLGDTQASITVPVLDRL